MIVLSICQSCDRALVVDDPNETATCTAYPQGIPAEIIGGEFDHRQPRDDDGGKQWVQRPGFEDLLAMWEDWVRARR
jgi:SH3-like domain-containing protein